VSLVLIKPDGTQLPIELKHERNLIGRQTDCQIRIPNDSVSRRHCEVEVTGGAIKARDLGSANGTYVNRKPIQETELHAGDVLAIGPAVFVVRVDGQPGGIDAGRVLASVREPASAAHPQARSGLKPLVLDDLDDRATRQDDLTRAEPDLDDSSEFDFDLNDEDAPKL
jgi:pSer/pThr/pTyr-binding forkhead associated (FHA) protein